ncbi:MAG TPA: histidine phosphatase family protein [Firmicutes bacterium]|nr:histidine phosphatase family protein [Bacillota bacterium]
MAGKNYLRVFLVRHGETDWNARGAFQGHSPISLNDRGRRQALLAGQRLRAAGISHIYTSDLPRARETAAIIQEQLGCPGLTPMKDLRELNFGAWEGLTFGEIAEQYPQGAHCLLTRPEELVPPGGEDVSTLLDRIKRGWNDILLHNSTGTIAVVTHAGPIRFLLGLWLKRDPGVFWNLSLPHCGIIYASFPAGGGYPRTLIFNI